MGGAFTFTVLEHFESMSLNLWCRDEVYLVYKRSTTAHSIYLCVEVDGILLLRLHLGDSIDVVLVADLDLARSQSDHTRLDADGLELRAAKLIGAARQLLPVDTLVDGHLSRVDAHDLGAGLLVRQGELDLPVKTAGTEQGGIQDVDTVGRSEHLDAVVGREAVELVEKLQHGSLDLTITGLLGVETFCAYCVELVDEDD